MMKTVTHKVGLLLSHSHIFNPVSSVSSVLVKEQILLKKMLKKYHETWHFKRALELKAQNLIISTAGNAKDHIVQNPGTLLVRFLGLFGPWSLSGWASKSAFPGSNLVKWHIFDSP